MSCTSKKGKATMKLKSRKLSYVLRILGLATACVALCTNLADSANADQLKTDVDIVLVLAIVGAAAVITVAVLVVHESAKKRTITGCVTSGDNGMSVTDEKDKRLYALSGDTAGVKPGERMTLRGKKFKSNEGKPPFWETKKIVKDFGVCQP